MPSPIRMPVLPNGPRQRFVDELFWYYREAGRPTLRNISAWIDEHAESLAGTASKETVRRMLAGTNVPPQWETVHAVFLALCGLAHLNPETEVDHMGRTRRSSFKKLWNDAVDERPDPWEPPF